MWEYAVIRIKDNDETIVKICNTKNEALSFGTKFFATMPKDEGILSLDAIEVDGNGQRINSYQKVFHVWY